MGNDFWASTGADFLDPPGRRFL